MSAINDGGPAFPIPLNPGESWDAKTNGSPNGMSLRDYFAGQALAGLMVRYDEHPNNTRVCAGIAREAADALIEELEGGSHE